jgi:2'-5' RNA ligase
MTEAHGERPLGSAQMSGLIGVNNVRPPRVFVGLKIAPEVAEQLAEMAQPLKNDSVRLVPSGDIHLTLVPPWNETGVGGAIEKLRQAICHFGCFLLTFEYLLYGPPRHNPRLLWAECVESNELAELRTALLGAYGQMDARPFRPHVTLARMPRNGRTIARRNPLDQKLPFTQQVTSVEIFQSPPKGPGGYQVLASLPLGTNPQDLDRASGGLAEQD